MHSTTSHFFFFTMFIITIIPCEYGLFTLTVIDLLIKPQFYLTFILFFFRILALPAFFHRCGHRLVEICFLNNFMTKAKTGIIRKSFGKS